MGNVLFIPLFKLGNQFLFLTKIFFLIPRVVKFLRTYLIKNFSDQQISALSVIIIRIGRNNILDAMIKDFHRLLNRDKKHRPQNSLLIF